MSHKSFDLWIDHQNSLEEVDTDDGDDGVSYEQQLQLGLVVAV